MSNRTAGAEALQAEDVLEYVERYYHIALVGLLMLFMLWVRVLNYGAFQRDDGGIHLSAVDSFYHWRATEWTVENYPRTMPYEIYTGFPTGRYVGQFGTLFDQIVATVAMIIGLGDPSQGDVHLAAMITVPVMAALVAIPVYLIAKKLSDGNRIAGLVAVIVLALSPGEFLRRSTAGQFQHHVAEVLFMAIAILAIIVALRVAEQDKPIWELVEAREFDELKRPAKYSVLAGLALSLYLWTWPPGVMLLGILGFFFAVHLCVDYLRGISPDHVAFVGAISLAIPGVFMLLMLDEWSTSVTSFGILQPAVALMVAVGCLFMAWLARFWNVRRIERPYYPAAIVGIGIAGLAVLAVVLPDLFSSIQSNVSRRILPFGASETDATIQEASAPNDFIGRATREFGMGLYLMLIGLALLVARPFMGQRYRAEHTLILVWSLFLVSMAMTQVRFWYYFILPVAIGTGYTVAQIVQWIDVNPSDQLKDVETYQVIVIVLVVMMLFIPFAPLFNATNAVAVGENAQPSHDAIVWEESNQFLAENTPEPGNMYGAGNEDDLEYMGTYDYPDGGDYEYPEGAYGVMSWWDYGHLITTQSERIPHSNPFQQNARSSSAYLQAPDEATAEDALDLIAEGDSPQLDELGELTSEPPEQVDSHEEIEYVMIDHQMAGGKFPAITQWTGPDLDRYATQEQFNFQGEEEGLPTMSEAYYDTQLASLYLDDAQGMENYRLVHENDDYAIVGSRVAGQDLLRFDSLHNEQLGIEGDWDAWEGLAQNIDAQRQQGMVDPELGVYNAHVASSVKTFERVEGATVTGQITDDNLTVENATAYATVDLQTDPGRNFTYSQEAEVAEDGSFELTVPYATTDELGPDDGYTDSTVTALDDYQVTVADDEVFYQLNTSVEEPAIYDGDEIGVDFTDVEPEELFDLDDNETVNGDENATDDGDETNGEDDGDGEDGDGEENTTDDTDGADTEDE